MAGLVCATVAAIPLSPAGAAGARPDFQLPFACATSWLPTTYDTGEVVNNDGTVARSWSHVNYLDFGQAGVNGASVYPSAPGIAKLTNSAEGKVTVDHGSGWTTVYQHMSVSPTITTTGVQVNTSFVLGTVASMGTSTGPHLHYAQLADGVAQTPLFAGASYSWNAGSTYWDGTYRLTNDRSATAAIVSKNCGVTPPPPPRTVRQAIAGLARTSSSTANNVQVRKQVDGFGNWAAWVGLTGNYTDIDMAARTDGRLTIVAIDTRKTTGDNVFYREQVDTAGNWSAWKGLSGNLVKVSTALA
jgi:hypothetical protein